MSATLRLDDQLLNALQQQGARHSLSWEKFALIVLADAANSDCRSSWHSLNQRRLDLIHKKYHGELNDAEQRELTALQAVAEQHLEQLDSSRLEWLRELEQRVEQLAVTDE